MDVDLCPTREESVHGADGRIRWRTDAPVQGCEWPAERTQGVSAGSVRVQDEANSPRLRRYCREPRSPPFCASPPQPASSVSASSSQLTAPPPPVFPPPALSHPSPRASSAAALPSTPGRSTSTPRPTHPTVCRPSRGLTALRCQMSTAESLTSAASCSCFDLSSDFGCETVLAASRGRQCPRRCRPKSGRPSFPSSVASTSACAAKATYRPCPPSTSTSSARATVSPSLQSPTRYRCRCASCSMRANRRKSCCAGEIGRRRWKERQSRLLRTWARERVSGVEASARESVEPCCAGTAERGERDRGRRRTRIRRIRGEAPRAGG